jgi:hypothetical protein
MVRNLQRALKDWGQADISENLRASPFNRELSRKTILARSISLDSTFKDDVIGLSFTSDICFMAVGVAQYNLSICSKFLVGVQWSQLRHKRRTTGKKKGRLF